MKSNFSSISWLVAFLIPFALVGLGVRLLLTPAFLQFEYRLPGFPPDPYGFSTEDRLRWGAYGITYLLNNSDISYLGILKFDDGASVFGERELSHMQDVKTVTRGLLRFWYAILTLLLALGFWARYTQSMPAYLRGLKLGGWFTLSIALISALIGTVGASGTADVFWQFFSDFHGLFFEGDSWLFAYSDTLIRLYPLRFWQDAILYVGFLSALGAIALALSLRERPSNSTA